MAEEVLVDEGHEKFEAIVQLELQSGSGQEANRARLNRDLVYVDLADLDRDIVPVHH